MEIQNVSKYWLTYEQTNERLNPALLYSEARFMKCLQNPQNVSKLPNLEETEIRLQTMRMERICLLQFPIVTLAFTLVKENAHREAHTPNLAWLVCPDKEDGGLTRDIQQAFP